jgi:hypothetical protein
VVPGRIVAYREAMASTGSNLERRVERLENDRDSTYEILTEIQRNQRHHDTLFGNIQTKLTEHDGLLASIQQTLRAHDERFDAIDQRFDGIDAVLAEILGRLPAA